jgi:beta-galactosidase
MGKRVHYYFNYSAGPLKFSYGYGDGSNLLDGKAAAHGQEIELGAWDLAIVEER